MSYLINPETGLPNINNVNFVFDLQENKFLYLEESIYILLGKSLDLDLKNLVSLVHEDDLDLMQYAYASLMEGKPIGVIKFRIITNDNVLWLGIHPFADLKNTEPVIFGNIMDVSDEIENFTSISRYANKKNSTLHMLAHDLRGPLGMANSLIAVLEKDITQPKTLEKTKAISTIIQEAIDLIGDLINREFLETVGAALLKKRIDLVKKVAEYIEECKRSAHLADRNFSLTASAKYIQVEVDEAKFMQVMNNLLSNALKFTHPNGIISIQIDDHSDRVEMTFSDNGIGIPSDLLPNIFDSFTSSKRMGLHGEPTTGLGLSIVKEVISWHDGTIVCESQEGIGTNFIITLPKDPEQEIKHY